MQKLALPLLAALTAACVAVPPAQPLAGETPRSGGTLLMADWEYPQTFDPLNAPDESSLRVAALVFSPLWGLAPSLQPYPDLVGEVPRPRPVAGGGMTLDLKLLPGLAWSDGRPIEAADIEFTLAAARAAGLPPALRVSSAERRSATEVVLHYDRADGAYLLLGPALRLLPSHRLAGAAASAATAFFAMPGVGSGPFLPVEALPDDHISFIPNPHYADGRSGRGPLGHAPYLAALVDRVYPSHDALIQALPGAETTIAFHLTPADRAPLAGAGGSSTIEIASSREVFLSPNHGLNTATGRAPPWTSPADPALLNALSLALDRRLLAGRAGGDPASGLYPASMREFSATGGRSTARDLAGARTALDADGWIAGADGVRARSGRRLEFSLLAACGSPAAGLLDAIAGQWRDAGAAVVTGCRPPPAFFAPSPSGVNAAGGFDMSIYSLSPAPDPGGWAQLALPSDQNWNRCEDAGLASTLRQAAATTDPTARRMLYRSAENQWLRSHCTIPLYFERFDRQVGARVRGFSPNPWLQVDTWNAAAWWLARPTAP